jgi:cytochrome c biogenesis protein CcmG, thiol:disulfide interchange protein DsbE
MKNKGIILLIVVIVGIVLTYSLPGKKESAKRKVSIGLSAPDFELKDIGGKIWKLSDLRGKVVLVNFWATWCDSCKEENPSFQKFIESEKDNRNFVAVTILYHDSAENAVSYLKNNGFTFNVLIDDQKTSYDYGITGVPETFILSKRGMLERKIVGPISWDNPDVRATIKKLEDEI